MSDNYSPEAQKISLKVYGGTPPSSGSLCRTCKYAHIIRGNNNQERHICTYQNPERLMAFEVAECNRYFNANQPALHEMEEIAWRVVTKGGGRTVGFVGPSEFQAMEDRKKRENDK